MWELLGMCEEHPSATTLTQLWVSYKSLPSIDLRCVDCRFFNSTLKFLPAVNTVTVDCPFLGVIVRTGYHFHCTCFTECGCIFLVSDLFKKSPGYIVISDACQWYTTNQSYCFIIAVNGWIGYCRIRCISKYYIIPYACMFSWELCVFVLEQRWNICCFVNIFCLFFFSSEENVFCHKMYISFVRNKWIRHRHIKTWVTCIHTHARMHTRTHTRTQTHTQKHTLSHTRVRTHMHAHAHVLRKFQTYLNHKPSLPICCQVHCSQGAVTFCFPRGMYSVAPNIWIYVCMTKRI